MSVSQDDRETLEREDASMLCNLEKIYNRKGVKQSDTTLVINELMKALADTNATVEISNLIDYPKQFLLDDLGVKQAGIDSGFLSKEFQDKVYPKGFPTGFQYGEFCNDETNAVEVKKHLFNQEGYEENVNKLHSKDWKLTADDIKEFYDITSSLAKTQLQYEKLRQSLETRDGETLEEIRQNRIDMRDEDVTEEELNTTDTMEFVSRQLLKKRNVLDVHLCNLNEPEVMCEDDDDDSDVITKCPISQAPIKNAAFAKCEHRFDYEAVVHLFSKNKKTAKLCPLPGCNVPFKLADIKKDENYQARINAKRRR